MLLCYPVLSSASSKGQAEPKGLGGSARSRAGRSSRSCVRDEVVGVCGGSGSGSSRGCVDREQPSGWRWAWSRWSRWIDEDVSAKSERLPCAA